MPQYLRAYSAMIDIPGPWDKAGTTANKASAGKAVNR